MNAFLAAVNKELMEQFRTRRFLIALVVLVFFGMLSPFTARYMGEIFKLVAGSEQFASILPPPDISQAYVQFIKNTAQFGVILGVVLAVGSVAQEKDKGTAALMLVKPLPRSIFLLAKFLAYAFTFLVGILLAGAAAFAYTWYLFGPVSVPAWLAACGLLWLYTLVFVAITLLCSTLFRSQAAAGGVAVGVILVLSVLGSIPALAPHLPAHLIPWSNAILMGQADGAWSAMGVACGIIVVCYLAAWLSLRNQEL
jgi:ABC-2 type transport system permease protein